MQMPFIVDDSNEVVEALLERPGDFLATQCQVLFFGPSGTGKSTVARQLLQRCARNESWSEDEFLELTGADFCRLVGKAYETNSIPLFRDRFTHLAGMLIDDIDDMVDRDMAQRELRNLLDAFATDGRLMLMTSRQPAATLNGIEPSLASRLMGSWTLEIKPPGCHARREIIDSLARQRKLQLTNSAAQLIAEHASGTYLELKNLMSTFPGDGQPIDTPAARQHLKLGVADQPTLRTIVKQTAQALDLKVIELRSTSRRQHIVRGRGIAMLVARELTNLSLEQIGKYFSGRDHTTVMHACRRTEELVETDPSFRRQFEIIRDNCKEPQQFVEL